MTDVQIARLVTTMEMNVRKYLDGAKQAQDATAKMSKQLNDDSQGAVIFGKAIDQLGTKMSNMAGQFRAMAAIESPFGFMKAGVGLAAEAEQMEISFGTMLRSAEKGRQLTKDLQKFAADTPMTLQGLQQNAKMLLQFGVSGSQIIPTLKKLGDVTGGDAEKMGRMTLGFGQMMSAGRVLGEELNQMREAGFNPLLTLAEDMAKQFGGPVSQHLGTLQGHLADGKIKVQDIEKAFKIATSEGGQFFGELEKQSKSFNGLMSTMHDDIDALKRGIGKSIIELFGFKEGLKGVSNAAQFLTRQYDELTDKTKRLVSLTATVVFGFGAAVVAWKVGAIALGMLIGVAKDFIITLGWLTAGIRKNIVAMGLLRTAVVALQFTFIAAAGAAVLMGAVALVKMTEHANGTTQAINELNEAKKKGLELDAKIAAMNVYNPHVAILQEAGGKGNDVERWKFISDQVGKVDQQIQKAQEAVDSTSKRIIKLRVSSGDFFGDAGPNAGQQAQINDARTQLATQTAILEALKNSRAELDKAIKGAEPKYDAGQMKELDAQIKAEKARGAAFGMSAIEAKIYAERMKEVDQAKVDVLEAELRWNEAAEHQEKQLKDLEAAYRSAEDDVHSFSASLEEQIRTFGKLDRESRMSEMMRNLAGGGEAGHVIEYLRRLDAQLTKLERHKSLMEAGAQTTEANKTPLEKYADQVKSLTQQLGAGAISQETYNRAMLEAQKAAAGANGEIQRLDGTLARSAEGRGRLRSYLEQIRNPGGTPTGALGQIKNQVVNQLGFAPNAQTTTGLLGQAINYLAAIAGRETVEIAPAALGVGGN